MQTYTIAELSRKTGSVCAQTEPAIITNQGKPQSLVFNIADFPIDESVLLAKELYGRFCVHLMQRQAITSGLDEMSLEDINAEIAAARESQ